MYLAFCICLGVFDDVLKLQSQIKLHEIWYSCWFRGVVCISELWWQSLLPHALWMIEIIAKRWCTVGDR